jgi:predicted alpha/beta superfamily hydrolase
MNSDDNYPVLYVLDGETHFFTASALSNFYAKNQQIPDIIVVAIPNVPGQRNVNFTPKVDNESENLGGADNFLAFMNEELIPVIESNYRTHNYSILFGHSLCGMFSIYTLFNQSEMFDAILAASPYLMWDEDYIVKDAEKLITDRDFNDVSLFISIGDEPNYYDSIDKLTNLFNANESGLDWKYNKYSEDDHASIPVKTLIDGLGYIFKDWPLNEKVVLGGLDSVQDLLDKRLKKYGIKTELNEAVINNIGYQLLQTENIDKAIEVFEYNVDMYPNSSNVYDSLGDGYDAKGLRNKALKNYRKAVKIGTMENSPNLQVYKANVERLETNL